ncbi:MAG: membrane protein insertase YidC [Rikenellaceae bacterium]|nr:membrane protein insertase YidC [Rikenellaceae bacterium]
MDKKTIIGLVLMVAVFVGYSFYMGHEQEEADKIRRENIEKQKAANDAKAIIEAEKRAKEEAKTPEQKAAEKAQAEQDAKNEELAYHGAALIERYNVKDVEPIVVENDVMTVTFNPVGGKISSVLIKEHNRYGKDENVNLINPGSAYFGIDLHRHGANHEAINTNDYLFDCTPVVNEDGIVEKVIMTLPVDNEGGMVKYTYTLNRTGNPSKDHLVDFDLDVSNIGKYLRSNDEIILRWKSESMRNEKSFTNESAASTIMYYDSEEEESDEIDATGEREHHRNLDWIALKQQYFTSALLAEDVMHAGMGFSTAKDETSGFVKAFDTRIIIPNKGNGTYAFAFYYGPNDYKIMSDVSFAGKENNLDEIIPMGGWLIGWFNRYLTIPIFNWLSNNGLGFGLIILILTIIVKLIILPLTYKSYMSTAKMRAIRPEMEDINKKYPKPEDAMKKQQALMELYRKAGVSPMGGCLPLLIQMPILWAMFRFFPASIELRGQSFLWADDLSSYDSIIDLPFNIPFYGSHVSLFALLMAISLFGYSYITYKQQAATTAGQPGAGVMKFMMVYFMPVMMLFFFNGYSSGLCYYYFLSQMLTMLIMYIIRRSVDDNKVRERLLANAAKPRKKSRFQERYEEALRQQQEQLNREQRRQRR